MDLSHIIKSSFSRNVFVLFTGTFVSQIFVFLFQLILRRIYPIEAFGAFAVYSSMVGIVAAIVSARYETTIILPSEDKDGISMLSVSMGLALCSFLVLVPVFYFFNHEIALITRISGRYSDWLFLVPFSIFFFSIYNSINYWFIRKELFKTSAINKCFRRLTEGVVQTSTNSFGMSIGLVLGDIAGNLINIFVGFRILFKSGITLFSVNFSEIKRGIIRYKEFALVNTFPALLNAFSLLLPVIFFNRLFNTRETAYFDLCRMVFAVPLSIIAASISQVLIQWLSQRRINALPVKAQILKLTIVLSCISLLGIIIILFIGPVLFGFIFSSPYVVAGEYARYFVFSAAIKFVVSPLSASFTSFERIKLGSAWQIGYFLLLFTIFLFPSLTPEMFIIIITVIDIFAYSVYYILIFSVVRTYEQSLKSKDAGNIQARL